MRTLFIGDIMGRSGRDALIHFLPKAKEKYKPDVIIVNGENAAHGAGINVKICETFYEAGVDVITTGNHVWDQREIIPYIAKQEKILRPLNLPQGTPGRGICEHQLDDGRKIIVINMMTRLFMELSDDPFAIINSVLKNIHLGKTANMIFIDLHGEATSEKMAFGHYVDGKVSAVIGTHTHVPTADCRIMPGGTAYQTDAGMTGSYESVIGVKKDIALGRFLKKVPGEKMSPDDGEATVCGTFIETDDRSGLALSISPVRYGGVLQSNFEV